MNRVGRLRERVGRSGSLAHLPTLVADIIDVTRSVHSAQVRVGVPISYEYKVRVDKVMQKRV